MHIRVRLDIVHTCNKAAREKGRIPILLKRACNRLLRYVS